MKCDDRLLSGMFQEYFMITKELDYFDAAQIAGSGQCFRMIRLDQEPGMEAGHASSRFQVISGGHFLTLSQSGRRVAFGCRPEEFDFWRNYFDLDTDYGAVIRKIPKEDTYLTAAAAAGSGIRILRQDPWEMIITFVISQQKTIPMIRAAVEQICAAYGDRHVTAAGREYFSFPSPKQLAAASLDDLKALKLGYRAKYIERICRDAAGGRLDLKLLKSLSYGNAMEYLTGFYGIGAKVANCICLFGLHHIEAFPVDTWIQKILTREYYRPEYEKIPRSRLYQTMVHDHFDTGCGGILQQYIFNYERNVLGG